MRTWMVSVSMVTILLVAPLLLMPAAVAAEEPPEVDWIQQFGTPGWDNGYFVAVDDSDNLYLGGFTEGALPGQTNYGVRDAFIRKYDPAGSVVWTDQFGSVSNDYAYSASVDGFGNIYVVGKADGALPGQTFYGQCDAFVRKYNLSGTELWTRQFGYSGCDYASSSALDGSGNIYVAGYFGSLSGNTDPIYRDAFVRKYDPTGSVVWTHLVDTPVWDEALGLAVDAAGNVYVAGHTSGALALPTNLGGFDAFVRKYTPEGTELWTRQFGSPEDDQVIGVAVDNSGSASIFGQTFGVLPGQSSSGGQDAFVQKYDSDGNVVWTQQFGTSADDGAGRGTVDSLGNAYALGPTNGTLPGQTSSGSWDAFVRKYDSSGSELWTLQFGTPSSDPATTGIVLDSVGNMYVIGYTLGTFPDQTNAGNSDVFIAKFLGELNIPPTVDAGPDATIYEGSLFSSSGSFTDPGADTWTAMVDYGDGSGVQPLALNPDKTFNLSHLYVDNGTYTVTVTVTDDDGAVGSDTATITVLNVAPSVGEITAPLDPVQADTEISASADFTDPGVLDTHTAEWDWGDETTLAGTVVETDGSGTASGRHTYTIPGVYTLTLTVTDDDGGVGSAEYQFVVVYDPSAGFVTGGGWIDSPEGACEFEACTDETTGKANFGFVSKYKKGATVPTGQTEFQFKAGNLNFHSDTYQWLVVAGANAKYKGTGTINGGGNYGFMLTATDGQVNGGGGEDKFRIKIWDRATDTIVYDNQMGDTEDGDATQAIGGGSIVIHAK